MTGSSTKLITSRGWLTSVFAVVSYPAHRMTDRWYGIVEFNVPLDTL